MASLAVTNTFSNGAVIVAAQHNTNFSDIVTYINNRNSGSSKWEALASSGTLVVDGASTLTGAVTASSTLGVTGATTLSSTLAITGVTTMPAGSAAAPSVNFGNAQTGFYKSGTNVVGFTSGGTLIFTMGTNVVPGTTNTTSLGDGSTNWSKLYALGIKGTSTNTDPSAGDIGEVALSSDTSFGNMASSGTWSDVTSISLTAGNWIVYGQPVINYNSTNFTGAISGAISIHSGNTTTDHVEGSNQMPVPYPISTNTSSGCTIAYRLSLSATTTVYLKTVATYNSGTPQHKGTIWATRTM